MSLTPSNPVCTGPSITPSSEVAAHVLSAVVNPPRRWIDMPTLVVWKSLRFKHGAIMVLWVHLVEEMPEIPEAQEGSARTHTHTVLQMFPFQFQFQNRLCPETVL